MYEQELLNMKRVKVTLNKPNPLFELWLEQWKEKAITQGSNLQHHFVKALNALRKYPLPLDSGKDCIILNHFGSKLCMMLDKKLEEFKVHQKEVAYSNKICECHNCSCCERYLLQKRKLCEVYKEKIATFKTFKIGQIEARNTKVPLSSWSFACYAILLTLYGKEEQDPSYRGHMHTSELFHESKKLYNVSLQLLDPDTYIDKSSISILIFNELICLKQFPIRYHLTKRGASLAKRINDILNLPSYDKRLIQIYFMKLKDSLPFFSNHVMNEIELELSPKKVLLHKTPIICPQSKGPPTFSEINLMEKEESGRKSYVLDHGEKHENENELEQSSNAITNILHGVQETVHLKPYNFDIILLVDIRETCGGKMKPQNDVTLAELTKLGVLFEVRHLKIGDFTWIAKCKYTKNELILPYIIERKRLDDLSASIKDGRFREQKFRLKQCGIQNLFYLLESYERYSQAAISLSTLLQASINSLVQDGFIVKYTDSHQDSMSYLAILTDTLYKIYAEKNLIECKKEDLKPIDVASNSILLMKFEEFNKAASKQKNFSVREMFLRQLLQLKGISVAKALAIVRSYPTPQMLINALRTSDCGETLISPIQYGLRKLQIGPTISKTIYLFYTQKELQ